MNCGRRAYRRMLLGPVREVQVWGQAGQAYRVYDGAGVQTAVAYDFKGGVSLRWM
ncbi:MAG: hypothetical protein KUG77_23445 [Nannocystaceae bacterium]|nr:hypothetical protein [Nannocystaceae bacterium]